MDEIKSGSILKSVPEEMRPCPEQKSLKSATGKLGLTQCLYILFYSKKPCVAVIDSRGK